MSYDIDHMNRYVSNVEEFIKFYRGMLGYELIGRGKKENGMNYAIMKGFGHELFISEKPDFKAEDINFRHIGYHVDDADALLAEFRSRGLVEESLQIIVKRYSRQFYIKDPDGFEIDLIQWTDKEGFYSSLSCY